MSKLPIPFAKHTTYEGHGGIDFPQRRGAIFRASGPGRVYLRNTTARGGHQIWVDYDNGPRVGYCHMDSFAGAARVGQRVVEGTQLGLVGSKGARSTGPHLHIEISREAYSAAVWKYFDDDRVVGTPGNGAAAPVPTIPTQEDSMFIAIVRNKDWYLVTGGKACLLGAASGARDSGAPILEFVDDWAVEQLKKVVTGIA